MTHGPLDALPLWLFFLLTLGGVVLSVEVGFRLGGNRRRKSTEDNDTSLGGIVGALIGMLAFILAFTFGLAASRFDDRRKAVLDEANAIETTFLRAGMLPETHRRECRRLLREYVDVRLAGIQSGDIDLALKKSSELQGELWTHAEGVGQSDPTVMTALFVQSLNEVIDLHSKRVHAGLRSRIPITIWATLFVIAMFSMLAMGYYIGLSTARRSMGAAALGFSFALVILLIADLDRPRGGFLEVSQQPLANAAESMRARD